MSWRPVLMALALLPLSMAQAATLEVRVHVEKVLYVPGEEALVTYTVVNGEDEAWQGEAVVTHVTGLDDAREVMCRAVSVAAQGEFEEQVRLPIGEAQFGHEVRITLVADGVAAGEGRELFAVAENLWDVALGTQGGGILHGSGRYGDRPPEIIAAKLAEMRRHYSNWFEKHFWAPDDWGDLTPEREEWISGQAARWENAKWLKLNIDEAHRHGIKAITYGKGIGGGPDGYELLRERPDFFVRNPSGTWGGNPDLWDFDNWQNPQLNHYQDFSSVWHRTYPDLAKLEALDHGIDELIEATRRFGWDGVRFDGQFSAVDDVVSTRNMQRLKQRVWKEFPDFFFGFNLCSIFDRGDTLPHEEREAMAGGGHWMQEAIGDYQYLASVAYTSWLHYAEQEWTAANRVREAGGTYHYIYRLRGTETQQYYKFAIGTLNGAHPVYGAHEVAPGAVNWGRFLTRWSALLWHPKLTPIEPEALGIGAEGLNERVLWRHWARSIPWRADEELLVLPFLRLPESDEIATTDAWPEAVTGADVSLPATVAGRLRRVLWLDPKGEAVELVVTDGRVSLPAISPLGILVLALEGCPSYRPIERPRFTEPVDEEAIAASLASGRSKVVVDPLRPELNMPEESHPAVVKTYAAEVSWSMGRTVREDPEAEKGRAAGADTSFPNCTAGGYFFNLLPGRYRITGRMRQLPASPSAQVGVSIYENVPVGRGYKLREGSMAVNGSVRFDNDDGAYREVVLTEAYEHHGLGFCAVFVRGSVAADAEGDPRFLLDWVKAERLETYNDRVLAEKSGTAEPAGTTVGPPSRVLWVRGLFDELYRLDAALALAFPDGQVTPVYQRHFTPDPSVLAEYGTIVLPNVPVGQFAMPGRKALRDWTLAGGHLVILGGQLSLGQGAMRNTFIEEILPCRLVREADVMRLPQPVALEAPGGAIGQLWYLHETEAKPEATVTARCGTLPMLMSAPAGIGRCSVFAGTLLGAPRSAADAFWNHPAWPETLAGLSAPQDVMD